MMPMKLSPQYNY